MDSKKIKKATDDALLFIVYSVLKNGRRMASTIRPKKLTSIVYNSLILKRKALIAKLEQRQQWNTLLSKHTGDSIYDNELLCFAASFAGLSLDGFSKDSMDELQLKVTVIDELMERPVSK